MDNINAIITALVTPFNKDGKVDKHNLKKLVNFQKNRVNSLFPLGSSGEGILMDLKQRKKALEIIVDENNGNLPIIAHVGSINTKDTIELAKHAIENKVDAVSAISPFFFKANDKAIINYYLTLSQTIGNTPFYLYNNPALATNTISDEVVKFFNKNVNNFAGIKDSSKSIESLNSYRKIVNEKKVFVGGDRIVNDSLNLNVNGAVSTLSNAFPEFFTKLYNLNKAQDLESASYYQALINKILDILFEFPYFSSIKTLLKYLIEDFNPSYCVKPIMDLTKEEELSMINRLREIKEVGEII